LQVPGLGYLTVTSELAQLSKSIHSIPRAYVLPEEYATWQEFTKTEEGSKLEWIQKSAYHRGVQIIPDVAAPELKDLGVQGVLVQQLVRPHLIGGRSWDVGESAGCDVWPVAASVNLTPPVRVVT
jgi:hypothetical protein